MYTVRFLVKATGQVVEKTFREHYLCQKFVNKLKYSKKCSVISAPMLRD